jgi:IS30 family transposase
MPAALSIQQRQEIIQCRDSGESFANIARKLNRSYGAVRNIYHRFAETGKLTPAYEKCRHTQIRKDEAIYQKAVAYKQSH